MVLMALNHLWYVNSVKPDRLDHVALTKEGILAMGRMMLQQQEPELFAIIDRGLSVGQDDRTVHIEATLTDADIEILQRMAEEQMPGSVVGSGS